MREVVIVGKARTPIGRFQGALASRRHHNWEQLPSQALSKMRVSQRKTLTKLSWEKF